MNRFVPPFVVRTVLLVGIAYLAYHYYAQAQQLAAGVREKLAEAEQAEQEAEALRVKIGDEQGATARALADMEKLAADARTADAAVQAQRHRVGDLSIREASIKAEIDAAANEAAKIQANVDALAQYINGMPLAVAKSKNEVESAERDTEQNVWEQHLYIEGMKRGDWRTYGLGPALGGRDWQEDGIKRYTIAEMFHDLHKGK
jgi:chromosome segregation ATPase